MCLFVDCLADDAGVTKCLLTLLFSLSVRRTNIVMMLRDIAQDAHREIGDIDQVLACRFFVLYSQCSYVLGNLDAESSEGRGALCLLSQSMQ